MDFRVRLNFSKNFSPILLITLLGDARDQRESNVHQFEGHHFASRFAPRLRQNLVISTFSAHFDLVFLLFSVVFEKKNQTAQKKGSDYQILPYFLGGGEQRIPTGDRKEIVGLPNRETGASGSGQRPFPCWKRGAKAT